MILITDQSIEARLADAHLKIVTAMDDSKINGPLLNFGFTEARFAEGLELYNTAFNLHKLKKKEYGEQFAATEELQAAIDELSRIYAQDVKVARVALKNFPHLLREAELMGERKVTYYGWWGQARQFYSVALENQKAVPLLAEYGLTVEKLTGRQQKVENLQVLREKQIHEKEKGARPEIRKSESGKSGP